MPLHGINILLHNVISLPHHGKKVAVAAFALTEGNMKIQAGPAARQPLRVIRKAHPKKGAVGCLMRIAVHILLIWIHRLPPDPVKLIGN